MSGRGEIRQLTGIRGIAACFVVFYHYSDAIEGLPAKSFFRHGYIAVDLFFVLSGLVLSLNYADRFLDRPSWSAYFDFLNKRFARVYPLYFAMLLVLFGTFALNIRGFEQPRLDSVTIVTNFLAISAWGFAESINGPSWSISTEFAAYLLFPLLVVVFMGWRLVFSLSAGIACLAAVILVVTRSLIEVHQDYKAGPLDVYGAGNQYSLLRCLAEFGLGCLVYRLASLPSVRARVSRPLVSSIAGAAALVLLAIPRSDVVLLVVFVILVLSLVCGTGPVPRFLASGPVHWLGLISYSIYLVHQFVVGLCRETVQQVLEAVHFPHPYTAALVPTSAIVILFAAATYYGIEVPFRNWLRDLTGARQRTIEEDPAAP